MEHLVPILKKYIRKDARIHPPPDEKESNNENNKKIRSIKIEESEGDASLKSVTINKFTEVYFAFKLDHRDYPFLGKLISNGIWKRAVDAVIFGRVGGDDYIFLVELKSKARLKESVGKFKSSRAFIAFLRTVFELHDNLPMPDNSNVISILFDAKPGSNKPSLLERDDEIFRHEGFKTSKKAHHETFIAKFIYH